MYEKFFLYLQSIKFLSKYENGFTAGKTADMTEFYSL